MRKQDFYDVGFSAAAVLADAVAIFLGFCLATWIRFDTGWIPLFHDAPPSRQLYLYGAAVATLLFLVLFRSLDLYVRPQLGGFGDKIPRLVRACGWGILLAVALAFVIRTDTPFSRIVVGISFFTVSALVLLERYLCFRLEWRWARRQQATNRVLVLGTDALAVRVRRALQHEPRLRSRVVGCLRTQAAQAPDPALPAGLVRGTLEDLAGLLERHEADQVILTDTALPSAAMAEIVLHCERALVPFFLIPDLFRILTSKVDMQSLGDIPLLGLRKWPLDYVWNRLAKRAEDLVGALVGLLVSAPIIAVAAWLIRRETAGPVFYSQDRCGERGAVFTIHKLRTMPVNAEQQTGPVWTTEHDSRPTRIGAVLRRYNLDELPQFWNVLKGQMSLVGPRPERPHFVEQFKEDISRYMWRHASKPGMTGWAQVNGLRGNTSLQERIQHDLYYLENWSLALDFKILVKTFFNRENAY